MKKKLIEIPTELFYKIVRLDFENDRSVIKKLTKKQYKFKITKLKNLNYGNENENDTKNGSKENR